MERCEAEIQVAGASLQGRRSGWPRRPVIVPPRPLPAAVDHPRKAAFRNQKPSVPRYCYLFISKFTDRRELSVGVLCITQGTIATRPDPRCGCKFINLESGVLRITKAKFQTAGLCRASACRVRVFSELGQLLLPKSACLRWSTAAAAVSD